MDPTWKTLVVVVTLVIGSYRAYKARESVELLKKIWRRLSDDGRKE